MQDVNSISQRPPVKPALQLHTKPVGEKFKTCQIIRRTILNFNKISFKSNPVNGI